MIKNRNVSIITDENNNQIVIINDKKFKGLSKDDWQQIEKYLKGYISDCYEITETNDVVYIGKEFPSEYAGSKSRIALKGARKKAKASASQGIPELIKIAKNPRWEENKEQKHNKDAKYGWYRYDIIHFLRREMLDFTAFPVFFVSNLLLVQRKKYYFNRATVSRNCSIVL